MNRSAPSAREMGKNDKSLERSDRGRRTQADRSQAMRARLSAAAYETIADGGLKALRLRSVAEMAGVSQGALLHHFPDKNAVTVAAIQYALTLARQDSKAWLTEAAVDRAALLRAMLTEFRTFFFSDRFWVAIGITMEASKDEQFHQVIRQCVTELRKPVYDAWVARLADHGWDSDQAERDVRSAAAMMSGLAIRKFWADSDAVSDEVVEEWMTARL